MGGKKYFDLTGKIALVTGASRGLGQYFGRALARAGADLVITSRKLESLNEFKAEIEALGRKVLPLPLDVLDYDNIQNVVDAACDYYGKIDILVNNAGVNIRKPALEVTWDDWNTVLNTNLRGAFFVAQAVAGKMIPRQQGRIINIASFASVSGSANLAAYCASKGGIKQLTMSLADDWGKHSVTVNGIAPGYLKTEINKVLYEDKEWVERILERIPLKRTGRPDDLEGLVVFLASDESAYITGQTILIDGGISTGAVRSAGQKT